jgi:hypothetical protein
MVKLLFGKPLLLWRTSALHSTMVSNAPLRTSARSYTGKAIKRQTSVAQWYDPGCATIFIELGAKNPTGFEGARILKLFR